jgi:hypothetical protein
MSRLRHLKLHLARAALFLFCFMVYFASPNTGVGDGRRAVSTAVDIVHHHTISLDHFKDGIPTPERDYTVQVVNGHIYPYFPWAVSLFAVPVVVAYDGLHRVSVTPGVEAKMQAMHSDWWFELLTMSLVVALTVVVMWEVCVLALDRISGERRRRIVALLVALAFAFGTAAYSTASRQFWQHGPDMLCLSVALLLAFRARAHPRSVAFLGIPLALAYTVRPTSSIPFVFFTVWVVLRHRSLLLPYLAGAALVLLPWVLVNEAIWHRPLEPYYSATRLGTNAAFWQALAGNWVSPGRGVLIFSPILGLAIPGVALRLRQRRFTALDAVMVATVIAHWVAISTFTPWWGGWNFGARLMSEVTPFLLVLGLPVIEWVAARPPRRVLRRAVAGFCAMAALISVFVNAQGAVFKSSDCWNSEPPKPPVEYRVWDWGDPQFLRGAVRFVAGPDRRGEIARGGTAKYGCPPEGKLTG